LLNANLLPNPGASLHVISPLSAELSTNSKNASTGSVIITGNWIADQPINEAESFQQSRASNSFSIKGNDFTAGSVYQITTVCGLPQVLAALKSIATCCGLPSGGNP
jgi:hypothetical protein